MSFVVPVRNGAPMIEETLAAIGGQADGRPFEILVIDDGSTDASLEAIERAARRIPLRVVQTSGVGAAAAINVGVRLARFPIICQVDQDVRVGAGWMRTLADTLALPGVAAAQGRYVTDPDAPPIARVMALDLEQRYDAIGARPLDHVCTGNVAYRADALRAVGLFDESMGYGYDNDMSYRLVRAGYTLISSPAARSFHRWRDDIVGYFVQQYGFGYGRLDVVARHPRRCTGDAVSPWTMMGHPIAMAVALAAAANAIVLQWGGESGHSSWVTAGGLVGLLMAERAVAGVRAARRYRDRAALLFPVMHLARDVAWVLAVSVWLCRRLFGRPGSHADSMTPREVVGARRSARA